jgi:hypothetical protein
MPTLPFQILIWKSGCISNLRNIYLVQAVFTEINIQSDSEMGGNILGTCSTNENKAKTPNKHGS